MDKKIFVLPLFLFCAAFLTAQSAQKIDEILQSPVLTNGQACYLAGTAAGIFEDINSYSEALDSFKHLKGFKDADAGTSVRLDAFSHLILKASGIKGDLWYRAANNPYYAFRFLKMIGIIEQNAVPSSSISPRDALIIFTKLTGDKNEK